jgi:hypothetical protein
VYNGITYNVYAFKPSLAAGAASKQYCLSYNLTMPTNIYVLAVGGGGGGGTVGGGAGGAGGVVMNSVTLPASANSSTYNNIIVNVGAGGASRVSAQGHITGNSGSNATVNFSTNASANIIAYGGGGGGYVIILGANSSTYTIPNFNNSADGTYSCTVTFSNVNNCADSDNVNVNFPNNNNNNCFIYVGLKKINSACNIL